MKVWEDFLKVEGWSSRYESVNLALKHYARKIRSEKTRENFLLTLRLFCIHAGLDPDALVALSPGEASRVCQGFTDFLREKGSSVRYLNVVQAYLRTFFKENGFRANRELRVERYHQPARYRKKPEYIPDSEEIRRMGYASGSVKNRAMVFALYTSGLSNSTLRAIRFKDICQELESKVSAVKIPVYPEMKKVVASACKGDIPYYTFLETEATKALCDYIIERKEKFGGILDEEPLFCSDSNQVALDKQRWTPVSKNGLEQAVKRSAKQAGIRQWRDVTPKCLRTAYKSALRNFRLDPKDQEFLMGHILPGVQDPYYDSSKVEDLRGKYAKIGFFKTARADKVEMIRAFAQSIGVESIEFKVQKLREHEKNLDEMEAIGRVIREELGIKPMRNENGEKTQTTSKWRVTRKTDSSQKIRKQGSG